MRVESSFANYYSSLLVSWLVAASPAPFLYKREMDIQQSKSQNAWTTLDLFTKRVCELCLHLSASGRLYRNEFWRFTDQYTFGEYLHVPEICRQGELYVSPIVTIKIISGPTVTCTAGTLTAVRHTYEVLELFDPLLTRAVDPDFILMDGNARQIEIIKLINIWKIRMFTEWIGQSDIQPLSAWSISGCSNEGNCTIHTPHLPDPSMV
ncbi:hypothetical protein TNCV_1047371 [Trichonephila clavipes]|nr:hypothetical protein TNCV_1047371 [Trichonephila clavipes]